MPLFQTIREAIPAARREASEQGKLRLTTLSMLLAALQNETIALRAKEQGLTDEQVIAVVRREVKRRKDAAQLYRDHGEEARARQEESENEIIAVYLPVAPDAEMVQAAVVEIVQGLPEHERTMGRVMKEVMARLKNAEGSVVREAVQRILQQ